MRVCVGFTSVVRLDTLDEKIDSVRDNLDRKIDSRIDKLDKKNRQYKRFSRK